MSVELDLFTSAEGTVASAAADPTFWSQFSTAATTYAQQYGYSLAADPSNAGSPSQNVGSWGDFTAWVQETASTTVVGKEPAAPPAQSPAASSGGAAVVGAVLLVLGVVGAVWWLTRGDT